MTTLPNHALDRRRSSAAGFRLCAVAGLLLVAVMPLAELPFLRNQEWKKIEPVPDTNLWVAISQAEG